VMHSQLQAHTIRSPHECSVFTNPSLRGQCIASIVFGVTCCAVA
jgi:hypothetical protein